MFGLQMSHEMNNMQREMDYLLRGLGFGQVNQTQRRDAILSVSDHGESFEVEAALPGLNIEKLDINVLGRRLTLSGEFSKVDLSGEAVCHRHERASGKFEESLVVSASIDPERVEAEYQQGMLKITLPKAASALPRKINVKAG